MYSDILVGEKDGYYTDEAVRLNAQKILSEALTRSMQVNIPPHTQVKVLRRGMQDAIRILRSGQGS